MIMKGKVKRILWTTPKKMLEENGIELFTYTAKGFKSQHAIFTGKI